jgi:hypothetical protein
MPARARPGTPRRESPTISARLVRLRKSRGRSQPPYRSFRRAAARPQVPLPTDQRPGHAPGSRPDEPGSAAAVGGAVSTTCSVAGANGWIRRRCR